MPMGIEGGQRKLCTKREKRLKGLKNLNPRKTAMNPKIVREKFQTNAITVVEITHQGGAIGVQPGILNAKIATYWVISHQCAGDLKQWMQ